MLRQIPTLCQWLFICNEDQFSGLLAQESWINLVNVAVQSSVTFEDSKCSHTAFSVL